MLTQKSRNFETSQDLSKTSRQLTKSMLKPYENHETSGAYLERSDPDLYKTP